MSLDKKYWFSYPKFDLNQEDYDEIKNIINSGWVSIGKHVSELEELFKNRFGVKHAIACSNATTGLTIAMKAAGWRNKRVAVPSFTWPSTLYALENNFNNTPVLCDIDRETWIIDKNEVKDVDAVISMDTFGNQSDFRDTNLPTIYDAAHGFDLPELGHRGLAEVISLSFTKLVTAMEGGMLLTQSDEIAETATELRRLSGRMGEINAFIAKKSIEYYDSTFKDLNFEIINKYKSGLDFEYKEQKITVTNHSNYSILFNSQSVRNSVVLALSKAGYETKVYYDPLKESLPNTEYVFSHILSLPSHLKME